MAKVFLSYAREDGALALDIARRLKDGGVAIWMDQLDIPAGTRWDREIDAALRSAEVVVVLLTPAAMESDNVLDEVRYAVDHGKKIAPVLLKSCEPPFWLRRFQHIDFTGGVDGSIAKLLAALGGGVSSTASRERGADVLSSASSQRTEAADPSQKSRATPSSPSPHLWGEGRGEGPGLAPHPASAPHTNLLPVNGEKGRQPPSSVPRPAAASATGVAPSVAREGTGRPFIRTNEYRVMVGPKGREEER